jgi:uncharacterized protein YkwD
VRSAVRLVLACTILLGCGGGEPDGLRDRDVRAEPLPPGWRREDNDAMNLLRLVNARRRRGGRCGPMLRPPVRDVERDHRLDRSARHHAVWMARTGHMSHAADGIHGDRRVADAAFPGLFVGETLARDTQGPAETLSAWLMSPGHCTTLSAPIADSAGVAVVSTSVAPGVRATFSVLVLGATNGNAVRAAVARARSR